MNRTFWNDPCLDCATIERPHYGRGLCRRCYQRRYRAHLPMPDPTRFAGAVADQMLGEAQVNPAQCWPWPGRITDQGYGYIGVGNVGWFAHRLAHERWIGPIPDGMTIDHICHTSDATCFEGADCQHRRCVNPSHFELVDRGENARRGHRQHRDACKHGHPFPEDAPLKKNGSRICRECGRAAATKWWRKKGVRPVCDWTISCPHGHPSIDGNVRIGPTGQRCCRSCEREKATRRRQAKRTA